jgi:hypothetical protein
MALKVVGQGRPDHDIRNVHSLVGVGVVSLAILALAIVELARKHWNICIFGYPRWQALSSAGGYARSSVVLGWRIRLAIDSPRR